MKSYEGLSNYLGFISKKFNLDICINDFVGFLNDNDSIYAALHPFLIHKNPFCMMVKSDKDLWNRCLSMKKGIRAKSQRLKKPYYGLCYCGVGEYIVPILCNDFVIGVVCAGEFNSHPEISRYLIAKVANRYCMDFDSLIEKYTLSTTRNLIDHETISSLLSVVAEYLSGICGISFTEENKHLSSVKGSLNTEAYVLSHALEFIRQNFKNDISIKDISNFCHCSESYISRIFKKKMKQNIKDYINHVRIDNAKVLLLNSSCSVAEISASIGFNDPNYFSIVFKNRSGLTPTQYRHKGFIRLNGK